MKRKSGWIALAILLVLLVGCAPSQTEDTEKTISYTSISAEEAKEIMETQPKAVILDVRERDEYEQGHIPDAVLLPVGTITTETTARFIASDDTPVLVYCRSGNRSKAASEALAELGYTQVYEFGGIQDWPYETES